MAATPPRPLTNATVTTEWGQWAHDLLLGSGVRAVASLQGVLSTTLQPIKFADPDAWDTDNYHSPAAGVNENLVIPEGREGLYIVALNIAMQGAAGGVQRYGAIQRNGVDIGKVSISPPGTAIAYYGVWDVVSLNVGDVIRGIAYQDTAGTVSLNSATLTLVLVGPNR